MRLFTFLFVVIALASVSTPSRSQDAATADPESTRVEADSENSEIRFYINGSIAAVLKTDGLHVRESIGYGGTLTDYGTEGFSTFGKQEVEEVDDAAE